MNAGHRIGLRGFTIVELLTTIAIVAILAVTVGMFFAKLLTFCEKDREEAYVREKLTDLCAVYADSLSIGSSISMSNNLALVKYHQEVNGVSFETGVVSHVIYLATSLDDLNKLMNLDVYVADPEIDQPVLKRSSRLSGDASLISQQGDIVSCTFTPLNSLLKSDEDPRFSGFQTSDSSLGYLQVSACYKVRNDEGGEDVKVVTAGRVVRLWNHN